MLPLGIEEEPVAPIRKKHFSPEGKGVYVNWAGIPVGIPQEYRTMGEASVDNLIVFFPWV